MMNSQPNPEIYDSPHSLEFTVQNLISLFSDKGVARIFLKRLSPNDNSKNQPYVGGHLSDLSFLPTGDVTTSTSASLKTTDPKRKIKYSVQLNYDWVSAQGEQFHAPHAKLIYYPQYPEVRLSGFLQNCPINLSKWMDPKKYGRSEGRILFLGVKNSGSILAYLATPESRIAKEINSTETIKINNIFEEISISTPITFTVDGKELLLNELKRIHLKGWIEGKRLNSKGIEQPYSAQNGGGYTLEAELGIIPNGFSDPDFHGWEVKQFGVKKLHLINSKPLTLMTPEPDKGFYVENGVEAFMRKYGYQNTQNKLGRFDFTGRHLVGFPSNKTKLTLILAGYDLATKEMIDPTGFIGLKDSNGQLAAGWSYTKIIDHWKRKHIRAVYIPSLSRGTPRSYHYGNEIRLFEGTNILKLLSSFANGFTYYDPGIKLENADATSPRTKRRNQFRVKSSQLSTLYNIQEQIDLLQIT